MTLDPDHLLGRISGILRADVGPAVADEYTRTQAYMASVILERVAKQLALASDHQAAEADDMAALLPRLVPILQAAPTEVADAMAETTTVLTVASLGPLVEALYAWGIDRPEAAEALSVIRPVLRRDIDRRMAVAT